MQIIGHHQADDYIHQEYQQLSFELLLVNSGSNKHDQIDDPCHALNNGLDEFSVLDQAIGPQKKQRPIKKKQESSSFFDFDFSHPVPAFPRNRRPGTMPRSH